MTLSEVLREIEKGKKWHQFEYYFEAEKSWKRVSNQHHYWTLKEAMKIEFRMHIDEMKKEIERLVPE